jgi:proline iminopeptidase
VFTDAFDRYKSVIPKVEQCNLISAFHRRLTGNDEDEKLKVATAWSVYEMATSRLEVDPLYIKRAEEDGKFAITFARIETHYFVNGQFSTTKPNETKRRTHTLTHEPVRSCSRSLCVTLPLNVCLFFLRSAPGGFFEQDGQLLRDAHILKDIPGTIVQGRYDMVCPFKSAWSEPRTHTYTNETTLRIRTTRAALVRFALRLGN